jgi:plastocyanin
VQIPDAGLYPFVTHSFAYTGLGAVGLIKVDPKAPAPPAGYPMMADPFSAGVTPAAEPNPAAASGGGGTTNGSGSGESTGDMPGMGGSTSSGSGSSSAAACDPNGTKLAIAAQNVAFSTDCLAAPAGKAFTIAFDNKDPGVPHNISIYADESASTALFAGDLVSGPATTTYRVPALDPGTYFFRCDVHPTTMTGTFIVR